MKKGLKITLLSVLGLVIVAGVLVWMEFGALIKGANSCVKLDDGLYYMEYQGDDGFDDGDGSEASLCHLLFPTPLRQAIPF